MTKCHFGVSCFFIDVNKKNSLSYGTIPMPRKFYDKNA